MHLTNLIDLIAEVAAKRVAKEGKPKEESPDAITLFYPTIWAAQWNVCHNFFSFIGFTAFLDIFRLRRQNSDRDRQTRRGRQ